MPRHNKTYRGKLTQRRKQTRTKLAFVLLIIIMPIFGMIYERYINVQPVEEPELSVQITETPTSTEVTMVPLQSKNLQAMPIEAEIRAIADELNFQWPDFLVKLAQCESRLDPEASNSKGNTPAGSTDRGVFQINNYWHKNISDECAYSVRCSTEYTIKLINEGKQHLWTCNKKVKNVPIDIVMSW